MGATQMQYFLTGDSIEDAYQGLLRVLDTEIEDKTWTDPKDKPGYVQVWEEIVEAEDAEILARNIMIGRVSGNPWSEAERTSNMPKFGPWYVIQVATSSMEDLPRNHRWLFFGWVNT